MAINRIFHFYGGVHPREAKVSSGVAIVSAPLLPQYTVPLAMIPVFWAGATITLLYTEPIYLYTHGAGYYSAMDLFKAGLVPTLLMIVIVAFGFPAWFGLFGF